jgi:hypothetical protein
MRTDKPRISFLAFYCLWAERMRWQVPDLHIRVCLWLEAAWRDVGAELLLLMLPRGHAKSTILEVFNAWLYFNWPALRILHQSESDPTALKTSRGTQNVLRHHPLTQGLLPDGQGTVEQWWIKGAMDRDARNASMFAKGILSNVTSSRADFIQNDDIEVPRNIATPEAREKLRYRLGEQVHIAVPGAPKLYIGTPHTHDSIYDDVKRLGAIAMVVRMFEHEHRVESADKGRYALPFAPEYVFSGIGEGARLLRDGLDYRLEGSTLVFAQPPGGLVDCYAGAAWPERFDRKELAKRRRECRTLNEWDSQYQLHAKPVTNVRLDPDRITPYDCEPVLRRANNATGLMLGGVPIVGASLRWDPSSGKPNSDVSAAALVFQDATGRRYVHRAIALQGEVAEFAADGKTITGGQVKALCDLVAEFHLGNIKLETNGIGGFGPAVLRAALKQRRLQCGVTAIDTRANKNRRILEGLEPLLLSPGMLWAHVSVLDGPLWDQMRDWNPAVRDQPDDYLDAVAAACTDVPERIGRVSGDAEPTPRADWGENGGVHEVAFER